MKKFIHFSALFCLIYARTKFKAMEEIKGGGHLQRNLH